MEHLKTFLEDLRPERTGDVETFVRIAGVGLFGASPKTLPAGIHFSHYRFSESRTVLSVLAPRVMIGNMPGSLIVHRRLGRPDVYHFFEKDIAEEFETYYDLPWERIPGFGAPGRWTKGALPK